MRVKICGIRRPDDALAAAQLGADAVGVLVGQLHPSAHFVSTADARAILSTLPPFVSGVLVSHLSEPSALLALINQVRPAAVQIHSPMAVDAVAQVRRLHPGLTLIKAVHCDQADPVALVERYAAVVDGVVADSSNPSTGQVGGTGLTHDWNQTARLVQQSSTPVLLAGGLNPDNVRQAIARVNPWGVDVNSGVKGTDGFQCLKRMAEFIALAKSDEGRNNQPSQRR